MLISLLLGLAQAHATPPQDAPLGHETTIPFAGNGGLRDWEPGVPNSGVVYVRDRRQRWYQVTLTGPCVRDRALDTLSYTTDTNGTFDRFSRVSVARYPQQVCGVTSIRTSLPPPARHGQGVRPPRS